MPYNPSPAQRQKNRDYWQAQRGLSDDEIASLETGGAGDGSLSDDEIAQLELAPKPLGKDASRDERSAAQGLNVIDTATFGFGDEAVGGLSYLGELARTGSSEKADKAYADEVKYARDLKQRWRDDPNTTAGDVASYGFGLLAGAPLAAPVFRGGQVAARLFTGGRPAATMVGRGAQNLAALGLTGAVASEAYQAGEAEGSPEERAQAVINAGAGPAILGATLGVGAGSLGAGGTRLAQRGYQALRGPADKAARYIAEKLVQGGQTVDDLAAAHAKAAGTGKPVALADVGPQGVRDAGAAAARTPGPGREIAQQQIIPRQEAQVARVSDDVGQSVGGKPGSFKQTADELTAARQKEAQPLYQKAFENPKPVVSKKIVEIANRPSGKAAIQRGLKIAADEGIPESELVIKDAAGNVIGYSAKGLHYAKLALDDMIESAVRSGDNSAARAFQIMKRELLGEMDTHIPGYAQARKVFAGHAANQRALERGRQAHNAHPDQIKAEISQLSEGEREFYRRGFAQRVIEEVEKSPDAGNAARRIFGNSAKRDRLRAILGDDEYNRLAERLGVEDAMYGTYRRTNVGSETAERQAAQSDIDDSLVGQSPEMASGVLASLMQGNISPLVHRVGLSGIASLLRGISQRARGQIAKMLFSSDPNEVKMALNAIAKEYNAAKNFQAAQNVAIADLAANEKARTASGAAAGTAYSYSPYQPF